MNDSKYNKIHVFWINDPSITERYENTIQESAHFKAGAYELPVGPRFNRRVAADTTSQQSIEKNCVSVDRVFAVTPDKLPTILKPDYSIYPSDLEYANMCSHLKVYKQALDTSDADWYLILEDDMICLDRYDIMGILNKIIETCPDDAQVIQLYCRNPDIYSSILRSREREIKFIKLDRAHWGAGAYLISKEGAIKNVQKFIKLSSELRGDRESFANIKFKDLIMDFQSIEFPVNVEAVAYLQLRAYTEIYLFPFITRDDLKSTLGHQSHISDHTYSNYMIMEIRRALLREKNFEFSKLSQNFIFILGANSFSCGMDALVKRFNKEHYIHIDFERFPYLPWIVNEKISEETNSMTYEKTNSSLLDEKIKLLSLNYYPRVGDAGNYYISYVDALIKKLGDNVKFVCLRDGRKKCTTEFIRKLLGRNHWMDYGNCDMSSNYIQDIHYDKCYPKYSHESEEFEGLQKEKLIEVIIEKYWDEYYEIAQNLQDTYPDQFKIFGGDAVVNKNIENIYKFLGIHKRIFRY